MGRKIEDEELALSSSSSSKPVRTKKESSSSSRKKAGSAAPVDPSPAPATGTHAVALEEQSMAATTAAPAAAAVPGPGPGPGGEESLLAPQTDALFPRSARDRALESFDAADVAALSLGNGRVDTTQEGELRVPKLDPLQQSIVPPEIVFFGEPRNPPPAEAARDPRYHGSLLYWARHATVMPASSAERAAAVFPKGGSHPRAGQFRLSEEGLSFQKILDAFLLVMDDLECSKAFIESNVDLVPSLLFLRALSSQKLSAQFKNDLDRMEFLKSVRRQYLQAHEQIFFPLNIEVQKAETRVMTYLARDEIREFAKDWDGVEMTLHFTTLLAARLTWDLKVKKVLQLIKKRVDGAAEYMAEGLRRDLMSREFREPATTAEVYMNASLSIERGMKELYGRVRPEVRLLHETYFMLDDQELRSFFVTEFCPRNGLAPAAVKEQLKIFIAAIAAVQAPEYVRLFSAARRVFDVLCEPDERQRADKWYADLTADGHDFETYEPDEIPNLIAAEQRLRDTGNAFDKFDVEVLNGRTRYTDALSGLRQPGRLLGTWLERDKDMDPPMAQSDQERLELFRMAFIEQSELRKKAESRLTRLVSNRLAEQERILYGGRFKSSSDEEFSAAAATTTAAGEEGDDAEGAASNILQFEEE